MKTVLAVAATLVPLCLILYYYGFFVTHAGFTLFRASYSFPTHWEGKIADTTGFMRRNFVIFKKYSTLAVEVETISGAMEVEVKAPDGSPLSPVSGAYGPDASFLIDVSRVRRCSVTLQLDHFNGSFCVALQ